MAIGDDISVAANGDIRRTGDAHGGASPGYYTVLELHRWLMDLADNATETGDDLVSIVRTEPSDRSTDNIITLINGYNIDDDLAEYLYDGSITQDSGNTIYDGVVNFGNTSFIQIVQNGALLANDYWNESAHMTATSDSAAGISSRFLLKVRTGGADIDGRRFRGLSRNFGNSYAEFAVNGATRGNNVLALSESNDINNNTVAGTVALWTDVVNNSQGYNTIDLSNGNGAQPYYSEWDRGTRSINEFYERMKWLTRAGSAETLYGLDAQIFRGITHEIDIDTPTGTFNAFEAVSWTGGTAQMLAIDSTTAGTKMWIQLLTGTAPTDNLVITGGTSSATAQVNVTVTELPVPTASIAGQSTGTAIIGPYGFGIEAADLTTNDSITDLTGTTQQPPNLQTFTVSGIVSGEDRVLVTQNDGADEIDYNQLSAAAGNNAGDGTLVVSAAIPNDTPASGFVFAFNGTSYDEIEYASYTGSTFTLTGTLPSTIATSANVFIAYINELAAATTATFEALYISDRSLLVKVRDGGGSPIKPFKTPATFGAGGGSASAIRTSDA